ncbi:MAG: hypothetical protein HQ500_09310 [Flavobacteriales bacterium]|nr:hypothetical protein [Flavobacteriales bacterium]
MQATTLTIAFLLLTSSLFAQLNFTAELKPTDIKEEVEILIVRNAEECLGYESSIYELIDGKREKVAFLYHDSNLRNAASNFYNLNAIREVLDDLSNDGFMIGRSVGENLDRRCDRRVKYTLIRQSE